MGQNLQISRKINWNT